MTPGTEESAGPVGSLAGLRALITGASGFIGAQLCRRLQEQGVEIHGVSRQKQEGAGLRWWQGDLAEWGTAQRIFREARPDLIFHLASHVDGSRALDAVLPTFLSNLASTVNLMILATEHGCRRFLFTGSMEEPEPGHPQAVPVSPYAVAKWAGSAYSRMFHALYQFPVVLLRVFMVYGPGQQDLRKLIPYVTLALLRGEAPQLSSGTRPVDWVYVDDVVQGMVKAAAVPGVEGQTVALGSGEQVTVRGVVEQLVRMINPTIQPQFGAMVDRPIEQVRVADVAATWRQIGWRPTTALDVGLRKTVDWYAAKFVTPAQKK